MDLKLGQSVCNSSNQEISQFHDRLPSSSSSFSPFPLPLQSSPSWPLTRWRREAFPCRRGTGSDSREISTEEKLKFFNPSLCLYSSLVSLSWPQVTCLLSSSRFYWLLFSFSGFYLRFYRFRILFVNENFFDLLIC